MVDNSIDLPKRLKQLAYSITPAPPEGHQHLLRAFNEFVECVVTARDNRETVKRVVLRMQHSKLAAAFDCLASAVSAVVEQRE